MVSEEGEEFCLHSFLFLINVARARFSCYTVGVMKTFEQRFTVAYQYPVTFCRDVFSAECDVLTRAILRDVTDVSPHRVLIVLDRGLEEAQPDLTKKITAWVMANAPEISLAAPIESIPGGEFAKKQDTAVERLVKLAYQTHFGRKDTFIAIGGGAVQDTVGYAATIIHRGCRLIRINSTTLSQADAGIGVKNGIDYASGKNFLGTFAPPYAVINDVSLLTTLSDQDWRNGISEAVKVATIKDAAFLQWIQEHTDALRMRDLDAMEKLVERTAELHLMHIAYGGDPFERGSARPLDFGHWSAHRLESITCWQLSHGEAVAIGIALDMLYASLLGLVSGMEATRVISILRECGLRVWCDELTLRSTDGKLAIVEGLRQFREHLGGELCVTLPQGLGNKTEVHEINETLLEQAVQLLRERFA